MKTRSRLGLIGLACAILIAIPNAAHAATAADDERSRAVDTQIAAIPLAGLRVATEKMVAQREAEGGTVLSVSFTPIGSGATTGVSTLAVPTDCGFSTIVTTSPGRVSQDAYAYCSNTIWKSNKLSLQLTRVNPFSVTDTRVVATGAQTTYNVKNMWLSIYYRCANTNLSTYVGSVRSTITIGSSTYTDLASDRVVEVKCGT